MKLSERKNQNVDLTDKEFEALERNGQGDILELSEAFMYITDKQKGWVSDDDFTRINEYNNEVHSLIDDVIASWG